MKKLLLTMMMVSAMLCCPQAEAQSKLQIANSERGISVGVNGSFNIPTFARNNDYKRSDYTIYPVGWGAGLFVNVPFAKRFSFQGEIQYDRFRGFSRIGWIPDAPYLVYEYVSVPLLAQYEFGKRQMFFLNFGPELRFTTRARHRFQRGGEYTDFNITGRDSNPVVLALAVGFGMRVPMASKVDFLWEARFTGDLTSINKDTQDRILNLAIKAGLAYRF